MEKKVTTLEGSFCRARRWNRNTWKRLLSIDSKSMHRSPDPSLRPYFSFLVQPLYIWRVNTIALIFIENHEARVVDLLRSETVALRADFLNYTNSRPFVK